ncbi:MAG: helix-turn-helix domain-containing protein [Frankiaceae bacterium]|nr:helix-turn-helix domain-containing protein [Frankiaceae bacterium]MBV9869809.1 helix-turn-helix domain-containing protein [Frankiaceae bacterium]
MAADHAGPRDPSASGAAASAERLGELRFLTVAEVATLMRVSKMTVYRLVNAATLPAVRVGRSVRVPEQAVHDYLRHSYVEAG